MLVLAASCAASTDPAPAAHVQTLGVDDTGDGSDGSTGDTGDGSNGSNPDPGNGSSGPAGGPSDPSDGPVGEPGGGSGGGSGSGSSGPAGGPGDPSPRKAPLVGPVDMQETSWSTVAGGEPTFTMAKVNQFPGLFVGIGINATWDAIQPTADGALDFTTIDAALAQVRQYNAANPSAPLGTILFVYTGANAPEWAKELDGGPFAIVRSGRSCPSGCPATIGKIWSPTYIAAWRRFQQQLAARYDTEPLVRYVAVTSCGQQTADPFVVTTDTASMATLIAAGYTDDFQKACALGSVDDYAPWQLTNVDYGAPVPWASSAARGR